MIHYMAFDPGKATGWCTWDEEGKPLEFETLNEEELTEFLENPPGIPKIVIIEDFRLFSHKAMQQAGSNMPASIAIGKIESAVYRWKAKLIKQPANIKPIAQLWTGRKPKHSKDPNRHWIDAFNHGEYYMIKNGIKEIKL